MSTGDIPEAALAGARAYEALHVQVLFREWAPRVLDAAGVKSGERVLDVACGTGVLAREALERVGSKGRVVGVDINPAMLAVARQLAPEASFREARAESLPFADGSFDTVVSQFGLMFFEDRPAAIREMLRLLAPGGTLSVAVWDSLERTPAYADWVAVLQRTAGTRAADALRVPYVLGDEAELKAIFASAGARDVVVDREMGTARFPSVEHMIEADLRGWLPVMDVHLDETLIQRLILEGREALDPYVASDGRAIFDAPALIVTCRT